MELEPDMPPKLPYLECMACKNPTSGKEDVYLLPCLHVLCTADCLQAARMENENWLCRKCRRKFTPDQVLKVANLMKKKPHPDNVPIKCGGCKIDQAPVTQFCPPCPENLCGDCAEMHPHFQAFQGHTVERNLEGNKLLAFERSKKCEIHMLRDTTEFCFQCQKKLCLACVNVNGHSHDGNHEIVNIAEAMVECRSRKERMKELLETISFAEKKHEEKKVLLREESKRLKEDVDRQIDRFSAIEILKTRRSVMIKNIETARVGQFNNVFKKLKALGEAKEEAMYLAEAYDQVDSEGLDDISMMNIIRVSSAYPEALSLMEQKLKNESIDDFLQMEAGLGIVLKDMNSMLSEFRETSRKLFCVVRKDENENHAAPLPGSSMAMANVTSNTRGESDVSSIHPEMIENKNDGNKEDQNETTPPGSRSGEFNAVAMQVEDNGNIPTPEVSSTNDASNKTTPPASSNDEMTMTIAEALVVEENVPSSMTAAVEVSSVNGSFENKSEARDEGISEAATTNANGDQDLSTASIRQEMSVPDSASTTLPCQSDDPTQSLSPPLEPGPVQKRKLRPVNLVRPITRSFVKKTNVAAVALIPTTSSSADKKENVAPPNPNLHIEKRSSQKSIQTQDSMEANKKCSCTCRCKPRGKKRKQQIFFTEEEDAKIVKKVCEWQAYRFTGGINLFKEMEQSKDFPNGRTYIALHDRFRKYIIPKIMDPKLRRKFVRKNRIQQREVTKLLRGIKIAGTNKRRNFYMITSREN